VRESLLRPNHVLEQEAPSEPPGHSTSKKSSLGLEGENGRLKRRRESDSSDDADNEGTKRTKTEHHTALTTPDVQDKEQQHSAEAHQEAPKKRRGDAEIEPLGIPNFYNACYMNSTLQALASVPEMIER